MVVVHFIHMKDLMIMVGELPWIQSRLRIILVPLVLYPKMPRDGKCHLVLPNDVMGSGCNAS